MVERVAMDPRRRKGGVDQYACPGRPAKSLYRVRIAGGDWEDVEETVRIVRIPCRFGGTRPYFICPGQARLGKSRLRKSKTDVAPNNSSAVS